MAGLFDMSSGQWIDPEKRDLVQRNMKQVGPAMKEVFGERVPNAQLSGPAAAEAAGAAGGRGLMARAASAVLGAPAMGAQLMLTPSDLGDGTRRGEAGNYPEAMPGDAEAGAFYRDQLTSHLMGGVRRQMNGGTPLQGTPHQPDAQPQSVTVPQESKPVEATPGSQEAAKAVVAQQLETQRQHIQNGALAQLKDNRLSRVEAATAVVDAQQQQTGTQLKPNEHKAAVAEEVGAMRKMGNSDLATYLSYALMGLGAVAAATDEKAATAFGNSFASSFGNYRNQQLQWAKFMAERQDKQFDQKLALKKDGREDRSADRDDKRFTLDEKNIGSQIGDREHNQLIQEGRLQNDTAQVGIAQQNADTNRFNANTNASQGAANLNLRQQEFGLKKDMAPVEKEYKLAQVKKANADASKAELGDVANLNQKEAVQAVDTYIKDQKDVKISDGAKEQVAVEWRRLREMPANRNMTDRQLLEKAFSNSKVGKAKRDVLGIWNLDPEIRAQ